MPMTHRPPCRCVTLMPLLRLRIGRRQSRLRRCRCGDRSRPFAHHKRVDHLHCRSRVSPRQLTVGAGNTGRIALYRSRRTREHVGAPYNSARLNAPPVVKDGDADKPRPHERLRLRASDRWPIPSRRATTRRKCWPHSRWRPGSKMSKVHWRRLVSGTVALPKVRSRSGGRRPLPVSAWMSRRCWSTQRRSRRRRLNWPVFVPVEDGVNNSTSESSTAPSPATCCGLPRLQQKSCRHLASGSRP